MWDFHGKQRHLSLLLTSNGFLLSWWLISHQGGASQPCPHSTLMIMVDLGESKLSHTFIATSCPFQLCYRKWHVKMSKWSWQLWWWAIWGKWDQNNDEVADDVDADDINMCKAISFLGFGKSPKRFWAEGKGGGGLDDLSKVPLALPCEVGCQI